MFLNELDQLLIQDHLYNSQNPYSKLTKIYTDLLDKHAPIKIRRVRGNQAPFMNKELSKAIMNKSRIRNRYLKWPSRENFLALKISKNKSNSVLRKTKKQYFSDMSKGEDIDNRLFWNKIKPFMSTKGAIVNDNIIIEIEENKDINVKEGKETIHIKEKDIISDEKILVELFNDHYTNIVKNSSGVSPVCLGNPSNPESDSHTVSEIIETYKDHPSITKIKDNLIISETFDLPKANVSDVNSIILNLNTKKSSGPDHIHLRIIRSSANIIDTHLTYIINRDIENNRYSEDAKMALVRPIYKKITEANQKIIDQ